MSVSKAAAGGGLPLTLVLLALVLCRAAAFAPSLQQHSAVGVVVPPRQALPAGLSAAQRWRVSSGGVSRAHGHVRGSATALRAKSSADEVTDDTWRAEVLECELPVLVFFSAAWCGPCRMVSPVVDEVMAEYKGVIKVVEICTDENPQCVAECKVRSVPTLMLFNKGKAAVTVVGAIPKNALVHALRKHLKAGV